MPRTTIRQTDTHTVTLTYEDESGETVTREFWVPRNIGRKYVREGERQVCERLSRLGQTLYVFDAAEMLPLIRREWRARIASKRAWLEG